MKEKNKIIVFITVVALFFIGLFLSGRPGKNEDSSISAGGIPEGAQELPNSHTAPAASALIAGEIFYDFGTISMKDGDVSKIFKVTNPGSVDILVQRVTTSCMCTTAYVLQEDGRRSRPFGMPGHGGAVPKANKIVKAGESLDVEVVYDPTAHGPAGVGLIERSVFLEDENSNVVEFKFKVNVTP